MLNRWWFSTVVLVFVLVSLVSLPAAADEYMASIRVANFSPNADGVSVAVFPTFEGLEGVEPDEWQSMEYAEVSDFYEAAAVEATVVITFDDVSLEKTHRFDPDTHYTIALTGLVVPDELERAAEEDEGFLDWLWSIVMGEDPTDAYLLQAQVMEDDFSELPEGEARLRFVHAAPGTEEVDLAFHEAADPLLGGIAYGLVSPYVTTALEEELEVRIAGSRIPLKEELVGLGIEEGSVHTIFLAGSPIGIEGSEAGIHVLQDDPR